MFNYLLGVGVGVTSTVTVGAGLGINASLGSLFGGATTTATTLTRSILTKPTTSAF